MNQDKDEFEQEFWGDCCNTLGEELKQLVYARRMELYFTSNWRSAFTIDMKGKSVIDIGGGPVSLLLKCVNLGDSVVIDPLPYPPWVEQRYYAAGIMPSNLRGEETDRIINHIFDEAWIYNVLQHVDDPALIIVNARKIATTIRLFEWINIPPYEGHPHMLTKDFLNSCLGSPGQVEYLDNEDGCIGWCYYGVFKGEAP